MKSVLALMTVCMCIAGCASSVDGVPQAQSFPTVPQYKFKSSAHWNLIAKDVADQVAVQMKLQPQKPIYVSEGGLSSSFERDFRQMLLSALVDKKLLVSTIQNNAYTLRVKTSLNQHTGVYQPGTLTALASTLLVVRDLSQQASVSGAEGLAVAAAADFAVSKKNTPPEFEMTLTTTIEDEALYRYSSTDIYYIYDADVGIYQKPVVPAPTSREFKVLGDVK